jgi:hypothetical protein
MSARMGDAIGMNVNKTGRQSRAGEGTGYKSGVSTGKGAINFPTQNRPDPNPSYFDMAKADDGRQRKTPR